MFVFSAAAADFDFNLIFFFEFVTEMKNFLFEMERKVKKKLKSLLAGYWGLLRGRVSFSLFFF